MTRDTRVGGRAGSIQIQGSSFRYRREDGGAVEGECSAASLEPGCQSVLLNGRVYRIAEGARGEVLVNGRPLAAEIFNPRELRGRQSGPAGGGRQEISAPMPGKVVRVLVQPGDPVEAGQGLVVVEAMKMQNEMKSPKAGRVAEVRTRPDAAVVAGEALIVVE
ncbi:MAG TPA: acetyl-CoA carboxylase biotin carboxyl carrier protein subunit [Bryobacteraceae bacterium]|nr:acetyl-CoA carboxylase biotin carboxyl carrier protein subunit [Bryobacteraceae bacterium]